MSYFIMYTKHQITWLFLLTTLKIVLDDLEDLELL